MEPTPPAFLATLGLLPPCTAEDVKQAYLEKVKAAHPDRGGTMEAFLALQADFAKALEYAGFFESRRKWISSAVERHIRHEECLDVVRRLGGAFELEQLDWLAAEIGPDFAQLHERIVALDFSAVEFDDDDLAELAGFADVLAAVRQLDLSNTAVTDAGAPALAAFPGLEHLALDDTAVGSGSVEHIEALAQLSSLGLKNTSVGWLAMRGLRKAMPETDIEK